MKKRRYLSPREAEEMLRRYRDGDETVAAIAAEFGVDATYPGLLAKRSGIPLRNQEQSRRMRSIRQRGAP